MHILILDDDVTSNLNPAAQALKALGHTVQKAWSEQVALTTLSASQQPFDLIVSDFDLGAGKNASGFIAAARSRNIPVMVWSSMPTKRIQEALGARNLDISEVTLVKKSGLDPLVAAVNKLSSDRANEPSQPQAADPSAGDINVLCIGEPLVEFFETKAADGLGTGRFGDGPIVVNGFAGEIIPNLSHALKQTFLKHGSHARAHVEVFSAVGDDANAQQLRDWLESIGLGTQKMRTVSGGKLATVTNLFDADGKAVEFQPGVRFKQEGREQSAAREMFTGMSDDDMRALLKDHTHLVVSAVGLGCARDRDRFIRFMQIAKEEMNIPVFFSTNIRPAVWKFDGNTEDAQWKAQARQWIEKALPYVTAVLASHADEKNVFGDATAIETRDRFIAKGVPEIVVTDGKKPLLLASNENSPTGGTAGYEKKTFTIGERALAPGADDSGAGDAFAGGYIASRVEGHSQQLATAVGAELGGQMLQWAGSFPPKGESLSFTPPSELARQLS